MQDQRSNTKKTKSVAMKNTKQNQSIIFTINISVRNAQDCFSVNIGQRCITRYKLIN